MTSRKASDQEKKSVLRYCEFVVLFIISIFVNFELAIGLLIAVPVVVPIIVGIKQKRFHFIDNEDKETKELTPISA